MRSDVRSATSAKPNRIVRGGKEMEVSDQDPSNIPSHVSIVKDCLLNFNRFVGLEASMLVLDEEKFGEEDGDVIPLSAYKTDGLKTSQRAREREFLENAKELADGARRIGSDCVDDGGKWRILLRNLLTNRKDDVHYCG